MNRANLFSSAINTVAIGLTIAMTLTGCQNFVANHPSKTSQQLDPNNPTYPTLPPAQDILRLKEGETHRAMNRSIKVTFNKVMSDDRCPYNARCMWAGNATVSLTVDNNQGQSQNIQLSVGDLRGGLQRQINIFGQIISLETVYPTPSVSTNLSELADKYLVDIKVTAAK